MLSNSLIEQDRAHLIHPVVSLRAHEQRGVTILQSAKGCEVTDASGHTLLDGFAGLWCVNTGYGHESIVEAAAEQMRRLPYATGYFHFGSEPAIRLAAKLATLTPKGLDHVFFTLGGSDAIDTAIRMVHYYNNAHGRPQKKQFIALERGYHGSSSNGAGLTGLPLFHNGFDLPHAWQHHIPAPDPYRHPAGPDPERIIQASVSALESKIRELGAENVAAFICEPVQGSGGVIVPPKGFLSAMQQACRKLDILFIVDEVITGFGRTGPMFACEHEQVEPDIMTMAKGLTAGYVPMGATIISDGIYDVLANAMPEGVPFGHGLTYSGHPVSAAVALEVIRLYENGLIDNGRISGEHLARRLHELSDHPLVGHTRSLGLLAGVEIVVDKKTKQKPAPASKFSERIFETAYRNGLIIRAFADGTIGLAPPLCITTGEMDQLIDKLTLTLDSLLDRKELHA